MRILNVLCGVAVLITTVHSAIPLVNHFSGHMPHHGLHSPTILAGMGLVLAAAGLSFIGGILLLRRS